MIVDANGGRQNDGVKDDSDDGGKMGKRNRPRGRSGEEEKKAKRVDDICMRHLGVKERDPWETGKNLGMS